MARSNAAHVPMSHAQQLHNRRSLDGSMPIINRAGLPDKAKAAVCQQVHATVLATVQWTIEQALEEVKRQQAWLTNHVEHRAVQTLTVPS